MIDDAARWDARYRDADPALATPPDVLQAQPDIAGLVPTEGTALDVASGLGSQTLWLALRGLRVTAVDVSPIAIERIRAAAETAGVDSRVDAQQFDLDRGLPDQPTDVDVLVCQRFRDPALYGPMAERLQRGGIAIVSVLSAVGAPGTPGPFHAPPGELTAAFSRPDLDMIYAAENGGAATVVVRRRN